MNARETRVLHGLEAVRRRAAAAASLVAFLSVRRWLGLDPGPEWIVALVVSGPALFGAWTEPTVAGFGNAVLAVRGHLLYWFLFAIALLSGVGTLLTGGPSADVEWPIAFWLVGLAIVGYGLAGPRALRLHGLLSFLLVFFGLAHGGAERFLFWGAWVTAMAVVGAADQVLRHAGRYRFDEPGAVARAVHRGAVAATIYLGVLCLAVAVGPRSEGLRDILAGDPRWKPAEYEQADPFLFLLSLLAIVVLSILLVRLHLHFERRRGGPRPEEDARVGTLERRGTLPAPSFSVARGRTDRERIAHLYRTWCVDLARAGVRRPEWMTPDEFAAKVVERLPASLDPVRSLTDLFQRACYSRDPITPEDVRTMRTLVGTGMVSCNFHPRPEGLEPRRSAPPERDGDG